MSRSPRLLIPWHHGRHTAAGRRHRRPPWYHGRHALLVPGRWSRRARRAATLSLVVTVAATVLATSPEWEPAMTAALAGTPAVAPGPLDAAALPSRALYGWGSDDWGQLADGSSGQGAPTDVGTPVQPLTPDGATFASVAGGGAFTTGLTSTGRVYAWGAGYVGQLGDGTTVGADTPQPVALPAGVTVTSLASGSAHTLALTSTGQVYAWGANLSGQLGDGTTADAPTPVPVAFPAGMTVTAVAAGGDHSLALTSTGQVYAWGADGAGQLGTGSTGPASTPQAVPAPAGVTFTAIAAGTSHSLALDTAGNAWAWGFDASGQLGTGSPVDASTMAEVVMPAGVSFTAIAAGGAHSLALTSTGSIYAWGSDVFGQLGTPLQGSVPVDSDIPAQPAGLPPLTPFVSVAAGLNSSYALTQAGVVWGWGGDAYGQLGDGSPTLNPVVPEALATVPSGTLATGVYTGPDATSAFLLTRAQQTVSFPALPRATYGDRPVDLAPTVGSGLYLTNTASGACSGNLTLLQFTGVGTCTLTSSQPGTFSYYPATATVSFPVARAPLAIEPLPATGTMGAPLPAFSYRLSGFRNHDTTAVVTGRADCRSTASGASVRGRYPITCTAGTLSATDYAFVPGPAATLTLQEPLTGYALVSGNGAVWALGPAFANSRVLNTYFGSMAGRALAAPVVGAAYTPFHNGYWLVARDGGIFSFGAAGFHGSMGGTALNRPVVGMAATPDGRGYWEVASDGGVFSFGDARFYGSTGGIHLDRPIVGMAPTPDGRGYWLVASDGGVFCFGDAAFYGSTAGSFHTDPVVGMAPTADGRGYWLATRGGAVLTFGDARFHGSLRYIDLVGPVVGIVGTSDGRGYWMAGADGGVFAFGDAGFYGTAVQPPRPVNGII